MRCLNTDGSAQTTYKVDALGRRIQAGNQKFTYSKDWQVIQDESSITLRQYVWSLAYVDAMVLRDFNSDGNMGSGNLGKDGSGLDQRIYPMQDANWNVTGLYVGRRCWRMALRQDDEDVVCCASGVCVAFGGSLRG